jgi:hypothetical protein
MTPFRRWIRHRSWIEFGRTSGRAGSGGGPQHAATEGSAWTPGALRALLTGNRFRILRHEFLYAAPDRFPKTFFAAVVHPLKWFRRLSGPWAHRQLVAATPEPGRNGLQIRRCPPEGANR